MAELSLQTFLGPGQPDVDRTADVGRVAPDGGAVLGEDARLRANSAGGTKGTFQPSA